MSTLMVTNEEYEIKQGKNVVITCDAAITLQAKYADGTAFAPLETVNAAGVSAAGIYDTPFLKDAVIRITAQTGETRFDYSPQT